MKERMEPFSGPPGVGSVLTEIEPKRQLVMRPPCLGVRADAHRHHSASMAFVLVVLQPSLD